MPIGRLIDVVLSMMETFTVWVDGGMLRDGGGWGVAIGWVDIVRIWLVFWL